MNRKTGAEVLDEGIRALIDEAIRLELNVGQLYNVFREILPEDGEFWWQLAIEEKNHAALLKSGRSIALALNGFPKELLPDSLRDLEESNSYIDSFRRRCTMDPPSREEAFNFALELERSAGEIHYQHFMVEHADAELMRIFQDLNRGDKDHAARIVLYMRANDIPINSRQDAGEPD